MPIPAISCRNLSYSYGSKQALRDVSWELQPGKITGLLGRNGAGKTTTINVLNSFLVPTAGSCLLLGEPSQSLSAATKARIGYQMEGHIQYPFFDVRQIERFYSTFYPRWDATIYYHLVGKIDVSPGQKVGSLSCGQRSQVALGLILAQQPDLIIFDDYSMGLDPGYRRLFVEVIRDYASDGKRSILLTSHIIQDLESLIDDVIIYRQGHLLVDQPLRQLLDQFQAVSFVPSAPLQDLTEGTLRLEQGRHRALLTGFFPAGEAAALLGARQIGFTDLRPETLSLEDVFIALTGKY
jgi:ABC-2 type transport system ATP-binding protein